MSLEVEQDYLNFLLEYFRRVTAAFARKKKKFECLKEYLVVHFCNFCHNFIYITVIREYWKYLVDRKVSDWNSKLNFTCSVNFIISLSEGLWLWRHLQCYWMHPSSNLRNYNNLATNNLWSLYFFFEKFWKVYRRIEEF